MAGDRAVIHRAIWRDSDFRSLSADAKYLYLALLSQPELSYCGVLLRAIALLSARLGRPKTALSRALVELRRAGFVLVDDGTDELMIRTYFKHDGVLNHRDSLAGALRHAAEIESPDLRKYLLAVVPERLRTEFERAMAPRAHERTGAGAGAPGAGAAYTPGARGARAAPAQSFPLPPIPPTGAENTHRGPFTEAEAEPDGVCVRAAPCSFQNLWELWPAARRAGQPHARRQWKIALANGTTGRQIVEGVERWLSYWETVEPRYIPEPANWLAAEKFNDEPPPLNGSAPDEMAARIAAQVAEIERMEGEVK